MSRFQPSGVAVPGKWTHRLPNGLPGGGLGGSPQQIDANRIGVRGTALGIYLFMHVIPFAEVQRVFLHINVPLVLAMCVLVMLMAAFTFRLPQFFQSQIAWPWTGLIVLFLLASAFGIYPRKSLTFTLGYAWRLHAMPLLICAIVVNTRQIRHIMNWMVAAHVAALLVCLRYGQLSEGRLAVDGMDYQNPNDLALFLIYGACLTTLLLKSESVLARLFSVAVLGVSMLEIAKTGSRAAFVTLAGLALIGFIFSPGRVRLGILAVTPALLVVLSIAVPAGTWVRLSAIVLNPEVEHATTSDENLLRALESQMARTNLQKRAIALTLQHPFLGVGPLMFADAVDAVARENGGKSGWQGAHNVYLEVASEAGIPALILYASSVILCVTLNYRCIKLCRGRPQHKNALGHATVLLLATAAFAINIFFCNVTFDAYLPMLVGLTAANMIAVKKEIQAHSDDAPAATPVMSRAPNLRPAVARS